MLSWQARKGEGGKRKSGVGGGRIGAGGSMAWQRRQKALTLTRIPSVPRD